jgi:hypothetical protein
LNVNILQTLREKLFELPAPPHREALFEEFTAAMFPGRALFLDFLSERHFERQVEIAREILLRLAFEARVFAPNKHIVNLLNAESRLAGSAGRDAYNGRDHFVHLVHLYLLGLYVFWYHETLHNKVREQLRNLVAPGQDRRRRAVGAMIAGWRTFVLFHDLGYPWEIAHKLSDSDEFLNPFRRAWHYGAKDASMFGMSQLLGFEWLLAEDATSSLGDDLALESAREDEREAVSEDYLLDELKPATAASILDNWGPARRMPISADSVLPRLLHTIFPETEILAVLESTVDGMAVAADDSMVDEFLRRSAGSEALSIPAWSVLRPLARQHQVPERLRSTHHWVFYIRNVDQNWSAYLDRIFSTALDEPLPAFQAFASRYLKRYPAPLSATATLRFGDTTFAIYRSLLDTIDFDLHDDGIQTRGDIEYHVIRHEKSSLPDTVLEAILKNLSVRLNARIDTLRKGHHVRGGEPTTLINTPVSDYLPLLLQPLDESQQIADELTESLSKGLHERIELKRELYVLYGFLKGEILRNVKDSTPHIFGDPEPRDADPVAKPTWSHVTEALLSSDLERVLNERLQGGVDALAKYHPSFAPAKSKASSVPFCDHGLASGLFFSQMYDGWAKCLNAGARAPGGLSGLSELLQLRGADEIEWLGTAPPQRWATEVLYTILVHNLYPKEFATEELREFKTKRDREPFTYLALLCDSLQPWDRKRLYNHATGRIHYTVYAEHFNLTILSNIIRIHEEGDDLHLEQRSLELRKYLDDYLEGVGQIIRLHLAEWRAGK